MFDDTWPACRFPELKAQGLGNGHVRQGVLFHFWVCYSHDLSMDELEEFGYFPNVYAELTKWDRRE